MSLAVSRCEELVGRRCWSIVGRPTTKQVLLPSSPPVGLRSAPALSPSLPDAPASGCARLRAGGRSQVDEMPRKLLGQALASFAGHQKAVTVHPTFNGTCVVGAKMMWVRSRGRWRGEPSKTRTACGFAYGEPTPGRFVAEGFTSPMSGTGLKLSKIPEGPELGITSLSAIVISATSAMTLSKMILAIVARSTTCWWTMHLYSSPCDQLKAAI